MLNAEINFEMNFSLPLYYQGWFEKYVQLLDINNDGIDEIKIDQISSTESHTYIYNQSGELLYQSHYQNNEFEKFIRSTIYKNNDNIYLIEAYSYKYQDADTLYIQLKTYNLLENTLIDSSNFALFDEGELDAVYNINVLNHGNTQILYIGIKYKNTLSDLIGTYYDEQSYLIRCIFENGYSNYIDMIDNCGLSFNYYSWSNSILSIGYDEWESSIDFCTNKSKTLYFNLITNEINYQYDEILSVIGTYYGDAFSDNYHHYPTQYRVITNNDLHQGEYGTIIYYLLRNTNYYEKNTICYSPNFGEITWESQDLHMLNGSCINPLVDYEQNYYCIDINRTPNNLRIFNRLTGEIILEQESPFEDDHLDILRSDSNSKIYFLFSDLTEITFYTIEDEIVDFSQNDIIDILINTLSNHPNPFNPTTTISYSLPAYTQKVNIDIYNLKGQKVKTLVNEEMERGIWKKVWDGKDDNDRTVSSGVYFYKLAVNGQTKSVKKCLLVK